MRGNDAAGGIGDQQLAVIEYRFPFCFLEYYRLAVIVEFRNKVRVNLHHDIERFFFPWFRGV